MALALCQPCRTRHVEFSQRSGVVLRMHQRRVRCTAKLYCQAALPAAGNLLFNSNCAGFAADMHLAQGSQLGENNLGAALVFACGIQLALSGLFNVMIGLEDPFARRGGRGQLDSVQVPEFRSSRIVICVTYNNATSFESEASVPPPHETTAATALPLVTLMLASSIPSTAGPLLPSVTCRTSTRFVTRIDQCHKADVAKTGLTRRAVMP